MLDERRARRDVISCDVMFVFVVRRRKSSNHWGDAGKGDLGESKGLEWVGGAVSLR